MKLVISLAPEAVRDLSLIWHYIQPDSPANADKVIAGFKAKIAELGEYPWLGHKRADVANPDLRFLKVSAWLVCYMVQEPDLYVLRVVHAARDMRSIIWR